METFFRFFASRHKLAWMGTILLVALGLARLTTINRSQYPVVDMDTMIITTRYPGASAEDVELNVTNKIEDELIGVTGLKRIFSTSSENISFITVELESDLSDSDSVKDEVRESVGRVSDFPSEVDESPKITEIKTTIFPVIEVGLVGDISYRELRELARNFESKLKSVDGVSNTKRYGYLDREVRIEVMPELLSQYQISIEEVVNAIKARNIRLTGGTLESYTSERNVVTLAQFEDPEEVSDVVIRATFEGPLVKVGDVANVKDSFEDAVILSRMNGQPAISFLVEKAENADILRTTDAIKSLIEEQEQYLPNGVEFAVRYDVSRNVRNQFDIVVKNGAFGLALVFMVLTLFLNWRVSVWVSVGIPVSVLGTIFALPLFGIHLDSITLTAMVIVMGIIVDDAIIISENIFRHREMGESPLDAAVNGLLDVWKPVLTTILTTFLAFAPMLFMPGMLGKFVVVIPITVSVALFISLLEGFFALPAHLLPSLKRHKGESIRKNRNISGFLRDLFGVALNPILKFRYVVVLLFTITLGGAFFYAANFMSFVLFPSHAADRFFARIELPTGSSLEASSDVMAQLEKLIADLPESEVASYGSRTGAFVDLVDTEKENYGTLMVDLTPFSKRDRTADQIVEELRQKALHIVGVKSIKFELDSGGPPTGRPVTIRVVGVDDEVRKQVADRVVAALEAREGVVDIERDDRSGKEQIEIIIDYEKLARLELNVATIANNVRIAYDGEVATSVRYGPEDVDFRLLLPQDKQSDMEALRQLPVPNARGRLINLSQVAELQIGPGPSSIQHFDGERTITITADVLQDVTTSTEATMGTIEELDVDRNYPGIRLIAGGEAQETAESMQGLVIAFIFGIVGIYFLLVLLFNSLTQPFLVLIAVPFGLIGVILAFALHGESLSFLAMIGTVGLAGVVVNDSLVLVDKLNQLRLAGNYHTSREYVLEGTKTRFRAILLTTLTTVAGLLPLAYGIGGADVYMGPMALALGYGILFATPLTLVLLPCLYLVWDDILRLSKRINRSKD